VHGVPDGRDAPYAVICNSSMSAAFILRIPYDPEKPELPLPTARLEPSQQWDKQWVMVFRNGREAAASFLLFAEDCESAVLSWSS
jgi:hypothetical protein